MSRDRDVRVPKERPVTSPTGIPAQDWHDEPTGVHTDAQVFRAVKKLGEELAQNKIEAARAHGALKSEVAAVEKKIDALDEKLSGKIDAAVVNIATVSGQMSVMLSDRRGRSPSSETRATVKETLADQVLAEQRAAAAHSRAVRLKLLGAALGVLTSGAVIGAVIHWVAS